MFLVMLNVYVGFKKCMPLLVLQGHYCLSFMSYSQLVGLPQDFHKLTLAESSQNRQLINVEGILPVAVTLCA